MWTYFGSIWNFFDLVRHFLMLVSALLYVEGRHPDTFSFVFTIALFMQWVGLFYYMRPWRKSGQLVSMVGE